MATIPSAAVDYLTREINALSADAQARVLRVLESIEWTPEDVARCREVVTEAVMAVLPTYTRLAAQASAEFYDAARVLSVGEAMGAEADSGYVPEATEGAIRAGVQRVVSGPGVGSFNDFVLQRVDYELKRSAGNSMFSNGMRDPLRPRYARVPTGAETCDFCLMLASRGFVYHSERSAGALNHWHSACDCRVIPGWSGDEVEGYDPDAIYVQWKSQVDTMAAERAERNGTTEEEEYARIMRSYGQAAKNAKRRRRA